MCHGVTTSKKFKGFGSIDRPTRTSDRPFQVGDFVECPPDRGHVESVWRDSVTIRIYRSSLGKQPGRKTVLACMCRLVTGGGE